MPYKPLLRLEVKFPPAAPPKEQCTLFFRISDELWMAFVDLLKKYGGAVETDSPPPEFVSLARRVVVEGIVDWMDVVDRDTGDPLMCTEANRAAIFTLDAIQMAAAYMRRIDEILGEAKSSAEVPTSPPQPQEIPADAPESPGVTP